MDDSPGFAQSLLNVLVLAASARGWEFSDAAAL